MRMEEQPPWPVKFVPMARGLPSCLVDGPSMRYTGIAWHAAHRISMSLFG